MCRTNDQPYVQERKQTVEPLNTKKLDYQSLHPSIVAEECNMMRELQAKVETSNAYPETFDPSRPHLYTSESEVLL